MRTIKFRGKRIDNGEWVYGYFTVSAYCSEGTYWTINPTPRISHKVERETVGQFTGLHDKNGKEIYEGDIVTDGVGKYKIVYDLKLAGYQPYCIFRDEPENYCEVIGNIYENPDLVKL